MIVDKYLFEDGWLVDVDGVDARQRQQITESINDKMASLFAEYPYKTNKQLAKEFQVDTATICKYAKIYGLKKKIENRGGKNRIAIEVVNLDGYIIGSYGSVYEMSLATGIAENNILYALKKRRKSLLLPGASVRYKSVI